MARTNNRCKQFCINHRNLLVYLFLVVATSLAYWQLYSSDFVNYDDDYYVYENPHVKGGFTIENIKWAFTDGTFISNYWIPLTWISHILDFQLYGMNSAGHHLTNLLFHIANTLILLFVFKKMTGHFWQSTIVAAFFALHPLHVESVAWVSERKDVLSTFFWLLTMLVYVYYSERPGLNRYLWVSLFFVLGLMAKPMLVTLPFVLLLMDFWPLGRLQIGQAINPNSIEAQRSSAFHLIFEKIPLFALTVAVSIAAYITQRKGGVVPGIDFEILKIQTANALVSYASYIGKMIWPSRLAVFYPHPGIFPIWQVIGALMLLVFLSVWFIRWGRKFPYLPVGWLWYLGTLVPVIGLVKISDFAMADRYSYVPLIGLFVIIAFGIPQLAAQWRYRKIGIAAFSIFLLTILVAITWKQVGYWKNSITLFEHARKVTNSPYLPHNNLGVAMFRQGRTEEAIEHYLQALRIKPDYVYAHYNMGNVLAKQGRTEEAIRYYLQALEINPFYEEAYNNLGLVLSKQGQIEEAIKHYLQALRIKPDYVKAHYNLGLALYSKGDMKGAVDHLRRVLQLDPNYPEALTKLKQINATFEELDREITHIEAELRLKPKDPLLNCKLGDMFRIKGDLDTAMEYYQKAILLQPDLTEALYHLAKLYIIKAEYDRAMSLYQKMLDLLPDHAGVYYNIACIYAKQNRPEEAVTWLEKSIEKGFDDWEHLKADGDLDDIRGSSTYKDFITSQGR